MSSIETKSWDAPKHAEESEEQKSTKETVEKKKKLWRLEENKTEVWPRSLKNSHPTREY